MLYIVDKHRLTLEGGVQLQGYICQAGKSYVSALSFLKAIGNLSFKQANMVVRHHRTYRLFELIEINEQEVPVLCVDDPNIVDILCDRIEATRESENRKNKVKANTSVDREQANRHLWEAAYQLRARMYAEGVA